jgi:hypothetical protein
MKLSKPVVGIIAVLLVLIGLRIVLSVGPGQSDQQQIEQALADSIQASKEGRPGGVMDKLSQNLTVNQMDTSGNRSQIAKFIKDNKPDVVVQNKHAVVSGDEAEIVSPVTIQLSLLGQTRSVDLEQVTMTFKRESGYEYLFIPTKRWKLSEVRVPEGALTQFDQ